MAPKKNKGKGKEKVAKSESIDFMDIEHNMSSDDYEQLIGRIRDTVGITEQTHGVRVLRPPIVNGKRQYLRLMMIHQEGDGPRCVMIFRATDLYFIGFESQDGVLTSLKPDKGQKVELTEDFSLLSRGKKKAKRQKIKELPFTGHYNKLVEASTLTHKRHIPVTFPALSHAIRTLASTSKPAESLIATSILTAIVMISEATRLRNIERTVIDQNLLYSSLGYNLCEWTINWAKVSKVIAGGAIGSETNATLLGFNLVLEGGDQLKTVEEAREIVAILPHSASSSSG